MGVRGLTTYINYNESIFLKDYYLHDTNLVIDGNSLCAQLYRHLNSFSAFGGDYDKFASYIKKFFRNLKKCKVNCYVLFDGSYEKRKLRTAFSRLKSKLNGASRLNPGNQSVLQIFPLLFRDVFKEILVELDVPHTVCEFEADDELAALARHLNCAVLSYDSDFFIYNVLYIPFSTLNLKPVLIDYDTKKVNSMECKIFKVENFVNHFGGLNEHLLPLFATLLGNDYVEKKVFENFFSHLKLPKSKRKYNEQQRCIVGVLEWLRGESLDSAVNKIVDRVKKPEKRSIFKIIKKSCEGYNTQDCESLKYFNLEQKNNQNIINISENKTENDCSDTESDSSDQSVSESPEIDSSSEIEEDSENILLVDNEHYMPIWLKKGIRSGSIPQQYINLYTHHLYFCSPQAEDYLAEDSFLCCLKILRFAFDMLTGFTNNSFLYVSRENENYKRVYVGDDLKTVLPFDTGINPFDCPELLPEYFHEFIVENLTGLDFCLITVLPKNFQLFMLAMLWWVKYCPVTTAHVYSAIICFIMLDAIDEKTGTFRGDYFFNNKYSKRLDELKKNINCNDIVDDDFFLNKNKIEYDDSLIAASVLLKYFELDKEIMKKPRCYDSRRVHTLAQFQNCLQQLNHLNTLCSNRYESTRVHKSYNGTFVYNLSNKLSNYDNPLVFVEQCLRGANTVVMMIRSLCSIFDQLALRMGLTLNNNIKIKKHRKKKGKGIGFLHEQFESEVFI